MNRAALVDVAHNGCPGGHSLLEFKWETRERVLGDAQGPEALERKRNAHPRIPIWIHWLCRGRDDRNQPLQQSASNAAVSNAQQEIGSDVRGRSGMQHPALDIVQLQPTRTVNQHVSVA